MAFTNIFSSKDTTPAGNLRRINQIVLAVIPFLIVSYYMTIIQIHNAAWQLYLLMTAEAAHAVVTLFVIWLIGRGRVNLAVWLTLGTLFAVILLHSFALNNSSPTFGSLAVLLAVLIAGRTIDPARMVWPLLLSVLTALGAFVLDLFTLAYGLDVPLVLSFGLYIFAAILILLGVILFRQFNDYVLAVKLLVILLVVTLAPLGIVSYLNNQSASQNLTNSANSELHAAAADAAGNINTFIADGIAFADASSRLQLLQEYLLLPVDQRAGSATETELYADLRALKNKDKTNISSVGLLDQTGRDVADTFAADVGLDKSNRDFFTQPKLTNSPTASPAELSQTTGILSIFFSAPVHDASGQIIGVLRIRYDATVMQQIVKQTAGDANLPDAFIVLLDENHTRLAHSTTPELILKSVVPLAADKLAQLQAEKRLPADKSAAELSTNLPDLEQGLNNIDSQPFFSGTFASIGGIGQATVVRLKSQPWLVVVAQPQATYLAPLEAQTRQGALAALLIAALVAFIALAVSQIISRPVVNLTSVARQIAAGDQVAQAKVESGDEIGTLAGTFNQMTGQLRQTLTDLDRRAAQLATVAEVGTATSTILETDKLLQQVVDLTKERFDLYHSHIYLMDEAGENLVLAAGAGEPGRQMMAKGLSIPLNREQSLVARAAREQKGVTVNDVTQAPDFLSNPLLPNTRSELAVPMIVGDKVLGVFDVQSDVVGRFTDTDINIQTTMAAQVATSVQNARQVEQTIATAAELAGIQSAVNEAAIVAITDVTGKIETVNDNFVRISKYSREELIGQDHRILNSGYHPKEFMRDLWVTIANGRAWRNEVRNKAKDSSFYWVDTTIAPILNERGKPVKYVAVRFDITQRKQAEEAVARRAAELATVAEVGIAASTVLEPEQLLHSVVNLTKERFNLYHSHIYLLDEAGEYLVLASGAGEAGRQMMEKGLSIPLDREQSLVARAARERKGVTVNDVTQAPDFLPNPLLPNTRSELAVPMIVGENVIGVFDVQSDEVGRFTDADISIQTTLAAQIAIAVQNARTFSQAQHQAERETALNVISQKIQSATTVEAVLQIAARELGRAIGAPLTIAQLGVKDNHGNNNDNSH